MKSLEFREARETAWLELDHLVTRAEQKGLPSLTPRELMRLPVLYRATLSSLSVARSISLDRNVLDYLESLATRAYVQIYGTKRGFWPTVARFLKETFPSSFRRYKWHIGLAGLLLVLGTVTGFAMTMREPENFYAFVNEGLAAGRGPTSSREELREVLYQTEETAADSLTAFATFLFTNNSRVGMLAFALGFAFGLPVFLLMFTNGLMLGAFAAIHHQRGLSADLWGWLLPHGITELTAVVICGGAGLIIAQALVFPGRLTRMASLKRSGRDAARLVVGAVLMLFIAGMIEGVFRQTVHSMAVRYVVAGGTLVMWVLYFGFAGRRR